MCFFEYRSAGWVAGWMTLVIAAGVYVGGVLHAWLGDRMHTSPAQRTILRHAERILSELEKHMDNKRKGLVVDGVRREVEADEHEQELRKKERDLRNIEVKLRNLTRSRTAAAPKDHHDALEDALADAKAFQRQYGFILQRSKHRTRFREAIADAGELVERALAERRGRRRRLHHTTDWRKTPEMSSVAATNAMAEEAASKRNQIRPSHALPLVHLVLYVRLPPICQPHDVSSLLSVNALHAFSLGACSALLGTLHLYGGRGPRLPTLPPSDEYRPFVLGSVCLSAFTFFVAMLTHMLDVQVGAAPSPGIGCHGGVPRQPVA